MTNESRLLLKYQNPVIYISDDKTQCFDFQVVSINPILSPFYLGNFIT